MTAKPLLSFVAMWCELVFALVADLCMQFSVRFSLPPVSRMTAASRHIFGASIRVFVYGVIDAVSPVESLSTMDHVLALNPLRLPLGAFVGLLAAVVCSLLFALLLRRIMAAGPAPSSHHPRRQAAGPAHLTPLGAVVLLPVLEELFYHHFLFRRLALQVHALVAFIAASLWFTINHMPATLHLNILRLFRSFVYSMLYDYSHHALLLPVAAHVLNNWLAYELDVSIS